MYAMGLVAMVAWALTATQVHAVEGVSQVLITCYIARS